MTTASLRADSDVLSENLDQIDACLERVIRSRSWPAALEDAVLYAVLGGGKRLRPTLVLLSCEAVGGDRPDALPPAAAIELIHNFSLVHDDLPAMDDDDLRRGRPTLHRHAGEAMAILAGDLMVSLAFQIIAESNAPAKVRARMTRELAEANSAMIVGQVLDTLGGLPEQADEEERLATIHRQKTGALLRAATRLGGLAGGASDAQFNALTRFGEAIGLMFQIVDDLLDVTQSTEHLGKAVGKDISAGKLTYPGVLGIDASRDRVRQLQIEATDAIGSLGPAADPLRALCDDLAIRTK